MDGRYAGTPIYYQLVNWRMDTKQETDGLIVAATEGVRHLDKIKYYLMVFVFRKQKSMLSDGIDSQTKFQMLSDGICFSQAKLGEELSLSRQKVSQDLQLADAVKRYPAVAEGAY